VNLRRLIEAAVDEDLGPGDLTTMATVPPKAKGEARVMAKQELVVCGHEPAELVFEEVTRRLGGRVSYDVRHPDGSRVDDRTVVATVRGDLRNLIIGERVALNFLMRLSGIATHTRTFVDAAGPDGPKVVDTRKTTPLHRDLEKHAVRCGGAYNHRRALFDGVMVKDNHIAAVGSLTEAVRLARSQVHHLVRIEVEARTLAEVEEAARTDAEVILLDNFDDDGLAEVIAAARAIRPTVILEASGNITPQRVAGMAAKGLDLDIVSSGGLIHQARWADLSMKLA
jgi:nicotinate-nucleotide pyrophosphorylase (carboxylating)